MQFTAAVSESTSSAGKPAALPVAPTTAIVPAAGFGTRLRPLTNSLPKEMLPVGRQTALERIVEELSAAGIRRVVFVLSPVKESLVRARFGDADPAAGTEFAYVLQPEMRGLGDAVLCAEPFVSDRAEPIVVALGDAVFEEPAVGGITRRLIAETAAAGASVGIVVRRVERALLKRYCVVKPIGAPGGDGGSDIPASFAIADIVEKPAPEEAPSDFAASARYLVTPEIFAVLRGTTPGRSGEIEFTDAMRSLLASGRGGIAVPLMNGERRHDLGNLTAYFQAFAAFALADPECGADLREFLRDRIASGAGDGSHRGGREEIHSRKEVVVE